MTVEITTGEVQIKDFCPRKLKKEINKALFKNAEMDTSGIIKGFTPEAMDGANDVAMLGMIENITLDGEPRPVKIETLDEMDTKDVDLIIAEINKITSPTPPNA